MVLQEQYDLDPYLSTFRFCVKVLSVLNADFVTKSLNVYSKWITWKFWELRRKYT